MDLTLFKGELLNKPVELILEKENKILSFKSENKFLRPKDEKKELIKIAEDIDITKINSKDTETIEKILKFYLTNSKIYNTAYNAFLLDYYLKERVNADEIINKLDEEGQAIFRKIYSIISDKAFLKRGTCIFDYTKEAKVIARYATMDLKLIIENLMTNIKDVIFKNAKPVAIFPLRYSVEKITNDDVDKMKKIYAEKITQWLKWREILRENKLFYRYLVNWLYMMLETMYPVEEKDIKELINNAEQNELYSKMEVIASLQQRKNHEIHDFVDLSLNKHLLNYLTSEFLTIERQIVVKKYDTPTFGYPNVLVSIASTFTSLPLFTSFNPPSSFAGSGLFEWSLRNLNFELIRENQQVDPYNLMPNLITFFLSSVAKFTNDIDEIKYLTAKIIPKIFSKDITKEAIKWTKQTEAAMQGKGLNDIEEITDEEVEKNIKNLNEILENYIAQIDSIDASRKEELDNIINNNLNIIDKSYEEVREEKDQFLQTIDEKSLKELLDMQKDFLISLQLVENDKKTLNVVAKMFPLLSKVQSDYNGFPHDILGIMLLAWMASIKNKGKFDWLFNEADALDSELEGELFSSICLINNTVIPGFLIKSYPLIETTAPTLILQGAQNIKELLLLKDLSEDNKENLYLSLMRNISDIYL